MIFANGASQGPIGFWRFFAALACAAASLGIGYAYEQGAFPELDRFAAHAVSGSSAAIAGAISLSASAYGVIAVSVGLFILALATRRRWYEVLLVVAIQLASAGFVSFMKSFFARTRPPGHPVVETTASYPSGHAAAAIAFYGATLWFVLQYSLPRPWRYAVTAALIVWIGLIGWARLALVAHYATDVAGGYLIGAAWLLAGTAAYDTATRRRVA